MANQTDQLQRYKFEHGFMLEDPDGYWVHHEDAQAIIDKLHAQLKEHEDTNNSLRRLDGWPSI